MPRDYSTLPPFVSKFTIDFYLDTPEGRDHRQHILERDHGMCRICHTSAHQLCWTTTEAFSCCRQCSVIARKTHFPTLDALSKHVRSLRKSQS